MRDSLLEKTGKKVVLLGNEAIVRGALESGVQFVTTYPGTPASEIGNTFFEISEVRLPKEDGLPYFEYSVNEKVALEAAIGASFSGLKTLVAMKNFGLNVCQDALLPFVYTGCVGPTVIVVADDPSCHSSAQTEQNSRAIAYLAHIPVLEPADPQEAKDFVKLGFEISEKYRIPVIIRITTRVAHQQALVKLSKIISRSDLDMGRFVKNKKKFVTMPPRVLEMKKELLAKIEKIREFAEKSKINPIYNEQRTTNKEQIGIITSGISYLYVLEALKELDIILPILKLGFFYPLPEEKIKKFIKNKDKVLIVEELEPWLEKEITRLAKDINPKLKIHGKDFLPQIGEFKPEIVTAAIAKLTNKKLQACPERSRGVSIPKRFPQPCVGCPYWLLFGAVKKALQPGSGQAVDSKKVIFGGDIGCYMLAGSPVIDMQDYLLCMGSSIGIAHGIGKATGEKPIIFIGDSTFFHAGIPALINTVFNQSNPLIIVMDNQITAMTGQQPNPGKVIKIEEIVRACGVKNIKVIDPVHQKELIKTIKEFLNKKKVSVIISRSPCIFIEK